MNYTGTELDAIVERHRQLSAAEHGKYVALGFVIGAALVGMLWAAM